MGGLIKAVRIQVSERHRHTLMSDVGAVAGDQAAPSRIAELEAALIQLRAELTTTKQSAVTGEQHAFERGHGEGVVHGQAQAQTRLDEQLQAVQAGIAAARDAFEKELQVDGRALAIDLAVAALERIVGNATSYRQLVVDTVEHHLQQIAGESVLSIEVASADFPDQAAITGAFGHLEASRFGCVTAVAGLAAGSCKLRLTLGRLDLSLPVQQRRLTDALVARQEHR